jgi:hypothetical protein
MALNGRHYLFPAASTYSIGRPYRQYVGLIEDSTVHFQNPICMRPLVDGRKDKNAILLNPKSEIALDTPCPLRVQDEIWLYYACMDRADGIWKTVLSIYSTE